MILMAQQEICFTEDNQERASHDTIDIQSEDEENDSIEKQIRKSRSILKLQQYVRRSSRAPSKKLPETDVNSHFKEDIKMYFTKKRTSEISPNKGEKEKNV